jgi:hypothetical protein
LSSSVIVFSMSVWSVPMSDSTYRVSTNALIESPYRYECVNYHSNSDYHYHSVALICVIHINSYAFFLFNVKSASGGQ